MELTVCSETVASELEGNMNMSSVLLATKTTILNEAVTLMYAQ